MRTTTYTCDRCKNTADTNAMGLDRVSVVWGRYNNSAHMPSPAAEWCRSCRIETGLEREWPDSAAKSPPEPLTIEDILREFIQEEVAEAVAGAG